MGSSAPDMPDGWDVVVLIGYLWANAGWRRVTGSPDGLPAAVQQGAGAGRSQYSCDGAPKQATTLQSHCSVSTVSLEKPYLIRENSATSRIRPRWPAQGPPNALGAAKRRGTEVGRWFCTVTAMLVSYVVRLHTDHVGEEEFAGQVEAVASGRKCGITSLHDLMEFVQGTIETETSVIREARAECTRGDLA